MKTGSLSRTPTGTSVNVPSPSTVLSLALSEAGHTKISPWWSSSHSLRCEERQAHQWDTEGSRARRSDAGNVKPRGEDCKFSPRASVLSLPRWENTSEKS